MITDLTVRVPSIADFASEQRKAEALALALRDRFDIATGDEYTLADEMLSAVARREAEVLGMRKHWTGPLYEHIRKMEADFRPWLTALETSKTALKRAMGAFRVLQERREREARELAAQAAETNDAGALVEALTVASAAAVKPDARATTRFMWRVESVDAEKLPIDYFVPDYDRLEGIAKSHKGDTPPVVAGVTFQRVAQIGARK